MSAWKRLWESLFDFSAGDQEDRRSLERIEKALAESSSDAEFQKAYEGSLGLPDEAEQLRAWAWLCRQFLDYRQADEMKPEARTLAIRYAADLRKRLGLDAPPKGIRYEDGGAEVWPPAPKVPHSGRTTNR